MSTYIMLGNWTDHGIKTVKESGKRLNSFKKLLAAHGGKSKSIHMTMGSHDLVAVFEAPDDESVARVALILGQLGNVRTTTLKAFPEAEMRSIVASLD